MPNTVGSAFLGSMAAGGPVQVIGSGLPTSGTTTYEQLVNYYYNGMEAFQSAINGGNNTIETMFVDAATAQSLSEISAIPKTEELKSDDYNKLAILVYARGIQIGGNPFKTPEAQRALYEALNRLRPPTTTPTTSEAKDASEKQMAVMDATKVTPADPATTPANTTTTTATPAQNVLLKIQAPNEYSGKQILIKSDRLVFNSFASDIIMGSKNFIALAANGEIHLNSGGNLYLNTKQGSKIVIGKVDPKTRKTEHEAVLGNNLKKLLEDILQLLTTFQVVTPSGKGTAGPNTASKVQSLKEQYLSSPDKETYILSDLLYIASNLTK